MVKMGSRQFLLGRFKEDVDEPSKSTCLTLLGEKMKKSLNELQDFAEKALEMGRSDPRKIIFAVKMGMALSIVSLLIFWKAIEDISQYSIWAILTVIVMFEYTIGILIDQKLPVCSIIPEYLSGFIIICRSNLYKRL